METRPTQSFHLKFTLSEAQFIQAHRAHLRASLFSVKNLFLLTTALAIAVVQTRLFGGAEWALKVFGGIWLAVIALVIFVYFKMPARIYRRNSAYSREQTLDIDESGLSGLAGTGIDIIPWSAVLRATDHPHFIFIHPRHGLPWVIPKEVFRSEDELREFDRFVGHQLLST